MAKMLRRMAPPRTIIYWVAFLLLALAFTALFRVAFLLRHLTLAQGIPLKDLSYAFLFGIKFDLAVLACVILPFLVISSLPLIGFENSRVCRLIIQTLMYIVLSAVFLLCLIDIDYYTAFGDHLGVWFYSYLDHLQLAWYVVSGSFAVTSYLLIWLVVVAIFIFLAGKLNRVFENERRSSIVPRIIYPIIAAALLLIGMRGGISLAPIDWGSAYFSNYSFANDLSLNGVFTLTRSLYESYSDTRSNDPQKYRYMSSQEALSSVQKAIASPGDSLLAPAASLRRLSRSGGSDTTKYNVVAIILESWSARYVGALGGRPDVTPFFDTLAQKSLLLTNLYASGLRTNRGLLSVLCSFPSLPGRTVMKRYGVPHPFTSIASILGERGYDSYFIYGGDLSFDNMGGFFREQGFKHFLGVNDFPASAILNKWGVPDHIVMRKANEIFSASDSRPFLGVIVTLTNHEPFRVPGKEFEVFRQNVENHDYLNTFHYSDWSLSYFFHLAEKERYFRNTIFVLVGDHGKILIHPDDLTHNFHIAALIYCPGKPDIQPRHIDAICGQVDLLPTILDLLGRPAIHESWGRDILAPGTVPGGFAFLNKDDSYAWVQDSLLLCEKTGSAARLYNYASDSLGTNDLSASFPDKFQEMRENGRALFQLEVEMVHSNGLSPLAAKNPK